MECSSEDSQGIFICMKAYMYCNTPLDTVMTEITLVCDSDTAKPLVVKPKEEENYVLDIEDTSASFLCNGIFE